MENNNELWGSGGVGRNVEREASGGKVAGFMDLEVYKNSYFAMMLVFKQLLPILPREERFDLRDQIFRSAKAIPRLIAEGHSKRHQNKGFQKYIDDAHAESNETIVSICQVRDIYAVAEMKDLCNNLINIYDKISRQLYKLAIAWDKFHQRDKSV